jgi:hypothetical protein
MWSGDRGLRHVHSGVFEVAVDHPDAARHSRVRQIVLAMSLQT